MMDSRFSICCGAPVHAVEYHGMHPHHHDGVSEWRCTECGTRYGRWSGKVLTDGEWEPRYGKETREPIVIARAWQGWERWLQRERSGW